MPKVFKAQLGAIMKAAVHGDVSVMLPMIANVEEVVRTREIMAEIAEGFDREGLEYKRDMKVGIMIETPAAVRMAEALAKHADFFSIGSNDLIQFTLAVDRNNMRVAPLYDMFHPAVLQSIRDTLYAGQAAGIDVSLCGEAAGNPLMVPLLVGMGFRTLSMNPTAIHHIKRVILACSAADCRTMTDQLLSLDSGHEIRLRLIDLLIEIGVLFPR
jgi:phosphotransferase system enzyme I (PtsI)